jgi:phosphate butyryltransferase
MLDRQKVRVAIAGADDDDTLVAAGICVREFDVSVTLFGKASKIESLAARAGAPLDRMDVVDAPSPQAAAQMATSLVSSGGADILMKGQVKTADFMRAVLNQEWGLRTGRVLSHVGALDMPRFDRMLFVTDGGINVAPDLKTKVEIVQNAIEMVRALGYTEPKVALLGAIETVNPEMQITTDAAAIAKMADRGQVKGALVDGPLALDTAVSPVAAEQKGLTGPVAGRADVLVVPNLESGNVLAKSMLYFGEAIMAGIVMGARKPIVLNSRADTAENKAASLALAVLLSR